MAPPPRAREPSIEYTSEYNDFISELQEYHRKRGTHLDTEPRVGSKHVDLLALYKAVVARGGYDKVSDEKLAWRKLGQEFNLGSSNLPALAFSLKSAYYRNLAAYEITKIHNKEPPPKEILEEVTAKGGGLLTRTLENYRPSGRRETGALGIDQSDGSGDDGTPVRDTPGNEDTPGSSGRVTRGLRQAPPQRVLFQPETVSSRQRTHAAPAAMTPQPPRGASTFHNPSSNPDNMSQAVANYEPRPQMPLTLRPVITPANNPNEFAKRQRALREQALAATNSRPAPSQRMMLPGSKYILFPSMYDMSLHDIAGFDGPNIYVRCLLALKSGIPAEQDYALHHLVKISMERGDKYRFESFPGLAEALIDKMLEVCSLFYDVNWQVSYLDNGKLDNAQTLDGLDGTADVLRRVAEVSEKDVDDNIQTAEFSDRLLQINEAALTFRNMVMLEENVHYVSELHPLRDFLCLALNLPNLQCVVELKHYALDITEQLTKYLHLDADDPLYLSLLAQLQTQDRGAILTSLRAISRISMNLEESNRLDGFSPQTLQNIIDWTLLDDEELVHACLDFLYQYTAVVDNVNLMLTELHVDALVNQLTRLLLHGAKPIEKETILKHQVRIPATGNIPSLPQDLLQVLLKLDEPDRSSQWLRCLFEEDKDESITQIALWQAYQSRFAAAVQDIGRPLLPAADFIKNVSTTFADKAAAQVQQGPVQKFIIKGIRIRSVPVDLRGREYTKCLWLVPDPYKSSSEAELQECTEFFMTAEQMYEHILTSHVAAQKNDDGRFPNEEKSFVCRWKGCHKYSSPQTLKLAHFAAHVKIHATTIIPASSSKDPSAPASGLTNGYHDTLPPPAKRQKPTWIEPAVKRSWSFVETPTDERGDAAGIPLTAVLVLRNLARNVPKTECEELLLKDEDGDGGGVGYVERLFGPVEGRLWQVFAQNKSLVSFLWILRDA
jgi:chromatin structure-remodeling complex subunit RSC9